jgi:hypothetical protein
VFLVAAQPTLLPALDLSGTLVFALDGAVTAPWVARLDIVEVITWAWSPPLAAASSATC